MKVFWLQKNLWWLVNNQLSVVYRTNMHDYTHTTELSVRVCVSTALSLKCRCKPSFVFVCACVCFISAGTTLLPARYSINAQPWPRLICHSCCIFAFILICTSPLNWLSIWPSCCSNLIVFVHYRWASNKVDTHTCGHSPHQLLRPLSFRNHLLTTLNTYFQTVNICLIFNVLLSY